jgi:hypothetical protein
METVRIRDPGWKKVGSGIWDKHNGSATLPTTGLFETLRAVSCGVWKLTNKESSSMLIDIRSGTYYTMSTKKISLQLENQVPVPVPWLPSLFPAFWACCRAVQWASPRSWSRGAGPGESSPDPRSSQLLACNIGAHLKGKFLRISGLGESLPVQRSSQLLAYNFCMFI